MKNYFWYFILLANTSWAQWTQQTAPPALSNFLSVFAIDTGNVGIAGEKKIIHTMNGGLLWQEKASVSFADFRSIHSSRINNYYSVSRVNRTWAFLSVYGNIGTYSGINMPTDSMLAIHFLDHFCGIDVGAKGKIATTCDSGATWQYRISGTNSDLNALWFATKDSGCAVGNNGAIVRSTNAGVTWTTVTSGTGASLRSIHFPSSSIGYAVGNSGTLLKSTNCGRTWAVIPTGINDSLNGVFFTHIDTGYVVGNAGLILKTMNGGANWSSMASGTNKTLYSVHFPSPSIGWAVGAGSTILKYKRGTVGLEVISALEAQLSFFPNPVQEILTVKYPSQLKIRLFTPDGKEIPLIIDKNSSGQIDMSRISAGIYFIEFSNETGKLFKKLVK